MSDQKLHWWQKTIAYEIYVKSFKDSNGDGIGDLKGITSELDYLKSLGVGAIWLTPCYVSPQADNGYDVADYYNIDPAYGTMDDMDELISEAGKRNIRIVMDLVFSHTSSENAWFRQSRQSRDNDKSDWYIWADKPTNWRSIFGGSAWTFDEKRKQYYLHTFLSEQPDLNWKNPQVRKAVIDVANFWADKGVGGFRMDAIPYIRKPDVFEDGKPDDEKIFAFRRENAEARATVLINLSSETALYDKALVEKAVQIAGSEGVSTKGRLSPYEAVVFEESSVEYIVLDKDEEGILRDFIYEAIFVPEGEKAPDRSILEKPEISMYYKDFGSVEADRCIVAKKGKKAIGAVWTRIMNDYGHLDDETPSLAVSLYKEYRGSGIGTVLMRKMLNLLKSQGFKKVSLSCQKANYAAIWYKALGFQIAVDKDDEYIMVYDL